MLAEKYKCCGCGACAAKCPYSAILMQTDNEGFIYPAIDTDKCINCNKCERVCPINNSGNISLHNHNMKCYAAYVRDRDLLRKSSSGGIATALSQMVISGGGMVFSVAYTSDFKSAEFVGCTLLQDIDKVRGTKYIQSRKNIIYKEIEQQCIQGKMTLVIGLPCEIAAVKFFLGKEYKNLYTCELICHGPTSEKVQKHFIEMLERKYKSKVIEYNVRYKKQGWTPLYVYAKFANGCIYENRLDRTDFFQALAIFLRPSCYHCEYKGDRRVADISIGDFWGDIETREFWNEDGVSAVMIHTEQGLELLKMIEGINVYPVEYEWIQKANPRIDTCEEESIKRKRFSVIFTYCKLRKACFMTRGIRKNLRIFCENMKNK